VCLQVKLSSALKNFISSSTRSYGKVKLVLKENKFWVETADTKVSNLQPARALHSKAEAYTVQHHDATVSCTIKHDSSAAAFN